MCGIAGFINAWGGERAAALAAATLAHRGPEDEGIWRGGLAGLPVYLIHRRLRVVDLSPAGHQPMVRGPHVLVFNGEIYNFRALRRELEGEGYRFASRSDTEVLLAAYDRWGEDCLTRLDGMFAFAIWDTRRQELFAARDRIGKKPLFYAADSGAFHFGSEIKAILATLDRRPGIDHLALDDYLTYLYIPYPRTIFKGIRQLPPATWLRVSFGGRRPTLETGEYWDPLATTAPIRREMGLREQLVDLLGAAVTKRLAADVPAGVLLSGGLDSSAIAALAARASSERLRSFSIGFSGQESYDEISFARRAASHSGCAHEVLQAEPGCAQHLAKIVWHFDQPFGNPTAILTYILAALTKRSVTVALAGDGGDELFGGYPRYVGAYLSRLPRALPGFVGQFLLPRIGNAIADDASGRHRFRRLREFLEGAGLPLIEMYLRWIGYFSSTDKQALYSAKMRRETEGHDSGDFLRGLFRRSEGLESLNRLAYVDTKSFLCCNVLEYADRMSMAHALELRAPFTDHRLVEFGLRVPFHFKFRNGESKWLLRRAMRPYLPPEILNRRKLGFNPPLGGWLTGGLRNLPATLLSAERVGARGLFDCRAVEGLLHRHQAGWRDHSLSIWALLVLELWFSMFVDGRSAGEVQEEIEAALGGRSDRSQAPIPVGAGAA